MSVAPSHWESDLVLSDGSSVHVRPIQPSDAAALEAFHAELSRETIRRRFFGFKAELSAAEVERFTTVDHDARVAFVAEVGDSLIAVARYDRLAHAPADAEVAFVVADDSQRRGLGSALLAHLASAARERGVTRFLAETLPENAAMLAVFRAAGFDERTRWNRDGIAVEMIIEPTDRTVAAIDQREHRSESSSVARLLAPKSVAVIGASRNPATVGHQALRNLLAGGFDGTVYPVNPSADQVASVKAYPSILDLPDAVDLAVIAVPAAAVLDVIRQCGRKGVAGVVVLSAGFSETGAAGVAAQLQLRDVARRNGMRLVGPNCIGIANTAIGLDATFSPFAPRPGRIAMQSQSGALGIAILERSTRIGLGLSTFVSVGNKADVSGNDLLQYWEDDSGTDVILLYLESFGNPRKFSRIARRVSRRKPIVAVKSGRSAAGVRAASSHTAAMASPDVAVDALFRQAGVIRVDTLDELFDMASLLGTQPLPAGRGVAIIGNSGGPGILATDACDGAGLEVRELSAESQAALRAIVDPNAAVANPVDLVAAATPAIYRAALEIVLADEHVDAVIVINTPTFAAAPAAVAAVVEDVAAGADANPEAGTGADKPIVGCFLAWPDLRPLLSSHPSGRAVPAFSSPEPAARALARAATYAEWRQRPPGSVPVLDGFDADQARGLIEDFLADHPAGGWVPPDQVEALLRAAGIPALPSAEASDAGEAAERAREMGFPVALKAVGPDIVHKSDVGGVGLDLRSATAVGDAYQEMSARIGSVMSGAVVQRMAEPGVETIIGVVFDPLFGPLVMFGLGGIATELLHDQSFRILPVTDVDAAELVRSLRASPLLFGYRGAPPAATDHLEDVLQRVGRLAGLSPHIAELDLNPVIVSATAAQIADARIRITPHPI
jgi:acetyl coenzyme A synthetase (ADP forming)-like protein